MPSAGSVQAQPPEKLITSQRPVIYRQFDGGWPSLGARAAFESAPQNPVAGTAVERMTNTVQPELADKFCQQGAGRSVAVNDKPARIGRASQVDQIPVAVGWIMGRINDILVADPSTEPDGANATTGPTRNKEWALTAQIFDAVRARVRADPKSIYTLTSV